MSNKNTTGIGKEGIFDARQLGLPKMILLGMQHTFAMFGATVLVPIMTGLNVSTTLLMAGLGTLLFHLITKGKVPAFLGSSFAFLGGYAAVAPMLLDANGEATIANTEMLPYACGGVVAAGVVYIIMSFIISVCGVKSIMKLFPPVVTGPIIISIGLILAPSAIDSASTNWPLALIALGVIIICNIWGKGMVKIVPILIGILVSYVAAILMGEIDFSAIAQAQILAPAPITLPKFSVGACVSIVPIALATMMEHIGDMAAISATTGRNYLNNPGLHRTLMGDGLATCLSALGGGPANTTYGENTGVLALTKVYDPRVMQIAAVFAIVLSFLPKFGAVIETIPSAIIGGVSFMLYGMISAIGVRNVVENKVDFTQSRNLIIAAVILVSALGIPSSGITFTLPGNLSITLSGLAIAAITGIVLNIIIPGNDYEFKNPDEATVIEVEEGK
ncbi:MAG: uracil-xanthine permease [Oscillospiraceae bacterium]|nr:uracil-xanthine permease [Oscillospiraceae bacterium]